MSISEVNRPSYLPNRSGANPPNANALYQSLGLFQSLNTANKAAPNASNSNHTNYQYQNVNIPTKTGYSQTSLQGHLTPYAHTALTGNIPVKVPVSTPTGQGGPRIEYLPPGHQFTPQSSFWGNAPSAAPSSKDSYSSPASSSYGGGSYGGGYSGGGWSPPPPMPSAQATMPTMDRYQRPEWDPNDPANITPTDMSQRPQAFARDKAKYAKLLGEEVI